MSQPPRKSRMLLQRVKKLQKNLIDTKEKHMAVITQISLSWTWLF